MKLLSLLAAATMLLSSGNAFADSLYSLDQMMHHPYRFAPAFGHASQWPGSPKFFRPGYGYIIPAEGASSLMTLPPSYHGFRNGFHTDSQPGQSPTDAWNRLGESPWYLPGASTLTFQRWQGI